MDDLISRQAAIDAIKNQTCLTYEEIFNRCLTNIRDENGWVGGIKDAIEALIELPSVQQEQRWIPCSERLPEANGRYLVTGGLAAAGAIWNRVYIANYSDIMGIKSEKIWWQGNVGKSDFERLDDVVSWMPLPEPYEGD